jgi:hypothetical protein
MASTLVTVAVFMIGAGKEPQLTMQKLKNLG